MCRSRCWCPFTPIVHHSLLVAWPCTLLPSSDASASSEVQDSENQWPDQRWQIIKEEELNLVPSYANNWEQWQLGFVYHGSSFSWLSLPLSVIFFSDAIFGLSFCLQGSRPLYLEGCCLMPCYSNGWSGWLTIMEICYNLKWQESKHAMLIFKGSKILFP